MRTNIEINDELLAAAQEYSKARTKRTLIEEALSTFIVPSSMKSAGGLHTKNAWIVCAAKPHRCNSEVTYGILSGTTAENTTTAWVSKLWDRIEAVR